jgi:hypothetical protein
MCESAFDFFPFLFKDLPGADHGALFRDPGSNATAEGAGAEVGQRFSRSDSLGMTKDGYLSL